VPDGISRLRLTARADLASEQVRQAAGLVAGMVAGLESGMEPGMHVESDAGMAAAR
jgi:8-amino-7-oxononanoate synthase